MSSTMKLSYQSPFLLFFILFIYNIQSSSCLSTISIAKTSNTSIICALVPPSNIDERPPFLNCTSFPIGRQIPFPYQNISGSALIGGVNFQCILRSPNTTSSRLGCWRFSDRLTYKRIYSGLMLDELDAGNSKICGRVGRTKRLSCWQWPKFDHNIGLNISRIAVGGDSVCGLDESNTIKCSENVAGIPNGNFSSIAAGTSRACAISRDGRIECWGETLGTKPPMGEFKSLALGDTRSCAIRSTNDTVVCWGESRFALPQTLVGLAFFRIEAQGMVFCGIVMSNYSLVCWGNGNEDSHSTVFERVLPGPCVPAQEDCPYGIVEDSGNLCKGPVICKPYDPNLRPSPIPSLPPAPTPPPSPLSPRNNGWGKNARIAVWVVGSVGSFSLAMAFGFFLFKFCKTRVCRVHDSGRLDEVSSRQNQQMPVRARGVLPKSRLFSMSAGGQLEEFDLQELLRITNNFAENQKIGYGSFGSVYRAKLDDGREVAIKRAELTISTSYGAGTKRQDKENAFLSELAQLCRVNHKHLVRLFGFCEDGNERVLVYEFMPNGSLHDHLHKLEASPLRSWTERLRVALDAARGVEYLHAYVVPPIIHRDIKSSNILLDAMWTAKVSDFGLSLMGPEDDEDHLSMRAAGTIGYVDPEYYRLQQLTTKSDVYSFGVVLLELLSGFKAIHHNHETGVPTNVVDFVVPHIINDEIHIMLDPKLPPPTPFEIEAVTDIGNMAADCVSLPGRDRPSMTDIVNSLDRALDACLAPLVISDV